MFHAVSTTCWQFCSPWWNDNIVTTYCQACYKPVANNCEHILLTSCEICTCVLLGTYFIPFSSRKRKGNWSPRRYEDNRCFYETLPKQELMRVEKREFAWKFSQLSCPSQTRTRVARELMGVEKREFAWELRSESLHESFLNSHAPVKREQELHECWWDLIGYYHAEDSHQNLRVHASRRNLQPSSITVYFKISIP
jgi:hypothetical protein